MLSKRLILSYAFDWLIIVIFAAAGGVLNIVKVTHRPFSLVDLTISYPFQQESITTFILALAALVAPALIMTAICLLLVPGRIASKTFTRAELIRCKLWEIYAGLTGLALSVVLAFFITQGLKNIFGKPRPHLLALCQPNVDNVREYIVGGGYGREVSGEWALVDSSICTQVDTKMLNDGFRSFPSGHCSFSWSGLFYLSLYLASKLAIWIPHFPRSSTGSISRTHHDGQVDIELQPLRQPPATSWSASGKSTLPATDDQTTATIVPIRNYAAAPPIYGVVLLLIPIAGAAYISSTRYTEFWHFGFDVMSGALIGILSAWFSFRWCHPPIQAGQGWAWAPRTKERAFGISVGMDGYVGPEGRDSNTRAR